MSLGRGGKGRIRPPRMMMRGLDNEDFKAQWPTIERAFGDIHTKNVSQLSYEQLYRLAYRVILTKKGDELYSHVNQFEDEWLRNEVQKRVFALLSQSLLPSSDYGGRSVNERRVVGEKFLKGLTQEWRDHQLIMSMLTDVLMYMDKSYCHENRLPSIYTVAMSLFRDNILYAPTPLHDSPPLLRVLIDVILDQIQMERDGDVVDKHVIKGSLSILENMFEGRPGETEKRLYVTQFEPAFLQASRAFYQGEAERMMREMDAGVYFRHTLQRIHEEVERCLSTLVETTLPEIQSIVETELIQKRLPEVMETSRGIRFMIETDQFDQLAMAYDLNRRIDAKKSELTQALSKRVVEMGIDVNNAAMAASRPPEAAADGSGKRENAGLQTVAALQWVEDVLRLKDKFDDIWRRSFDEDQLIQAALTKSFSDFINSTTFPRTSEYISLFIDENMRKGIKDKSESEVDAVLEKAVVLLRYVQDKDMFERYYKKHLCRRLLMQKSISIDVEKQMIGRMKIELGNNFTLKLDAMFKDMTISEGLTSEFKKHVSQLGDVDPRRIELNIHVLTNTIWPLDTIGAGIGDNLNYSFPPVIQRVKRGFEKFYNQRHTGRQLKWLPTMGTADIRAVFPKVKQKDGSFKERRHELNVSTYAMVILLLFNDLAPGESLSFNEIQARTSIPTTDLVRNLQSLAVAPKTRILIKEPMSKDIKPEDRFFFNEGFQGKSVRIKVGVVAAGNKVEDERERHDTEKKNDESRAFCIEAAVVRIMKQRKELAHQQLVAETLSQLHNQFKPEVSMIKKRIESLIEREYLERVEGASVPSYRYLA